MQASRSGRLSSTDPSLPVTRARSHSFDREGAIDRDKLIGETRKAGFLPGRAVRRSRQKPLLRPSGRVNLPGNAVASFWKQEGFLQLCAPYPNKFIPSNSLKWKGPDPKARLNSSSVQDLILQTMPLSRSQTDKPVVCSMKRHGPMVVPCGQEVGLEAY